MREVLEEVPGPNRKKVLKQIDAAEALPSCSKQQRAALHAIWISMTDEQRRKMVEDESYSGGDSDDDSSDDSEEEASQRAGGASASVAKGGAKQKGALPPPGQRTCPRGHSLTPVNSKPDDYKKLQGGSGNCDLCDKDFKYTSGGYHCSTCRNWDCCVGCGSKASTASNAKACKSGKPGNSHKRGKR